MPTKTTALDQLAAQADSLGEPQDDAAGPVPAGPAAETQAERNTRALCTLVALLREVTASPLLFTPPLQTLKHGLADDKLPALAGPWAAVLDHYGVDLLGGFDHPLAVALITTGPQLWAIAADLRSELAARRAKPVQAEPDSADPGRAE